MGMGIGSYTRLSCGVESMTSWPGTKHVLLVTRTLKSIFAVQGQVFETDGWLLRHTSRKVAFSRDSIIDACVRKQAAGRYAPR